VVADDGEFGRWHGDEGVRAGASGAPRTALTWLTGISRSRSRRITCAVGTCATE
jgi:hypothetical protein